MSLHSATPVVLGFARYFAGPLCPHCGQSHVAPEQSEFVSEVVIHHTWSCDACGHEFRTTVEIERDAA